MESRYVGSKLHTYQLIVTKQYHIRFSLGYDVIVCKKSASLVVALPPVNDLRDNLRTGVLTYNRHTSYVTSYIINSDVY